MKKYKRLLSGFLAFCLLTTTLITGVVPVYGENLQTIKVLRVAYYEVWKHSGSGPWQDTFGNDGVHPGSTNIKFTLTASEMKTNIGDVKRVVGITPMGYNDTYPGRGIRQDYSTHTETQWANMKDFAVPSGNLSVSKGADLGNGKFEINVTVSELKANKDIGMPSRGAIDRKSNLVSQGQTFANGVQGWRFYIPYIVEYEVATYDATYTIYHKDKNTNADLTAPEFKTVLPVNPNTVYQASAKSIPGYTVNGPSTQSVTLSKQGNASMTFLYDKDALVVPNTKDLIAKLEVPLRAKVGESFSVDGSQSYAIGTSITQYAWAQGSTILSDKQGQQSFTHSFNTVGTYPFTLTITNGTITRSVTKSIEIYADTPPPGPEIGTVDINAPPRVYTNQNFAVTASISSGYSENFQVLNMNGDDKSGNMVGTLKIGTVTINMNQEGVYRYRIIAGNERTSDEAITEVVTPYPTAKIATDSPKAQLTIGVNANQSTANYADVPIDTTKTTWKLETLSIPEANLTVTGLTKSGASWINTGSQNFSFRSAIQGDVKITLTVTNIYGFSHTTSKILTLTENKPPVARLSTDAVVYRDLANGNKAEINVYDASVSPDADPIVRRAYVRTFDSNNDGNFEDEKVWIRWNGIFYEQTITYGQAKTNGWAIGMNPEWGNDTQIKDYVTSVGRYRYDIIAFESPESQAESFKTANGNNVCDVDNIAPSVYFNLDKTEKRNFVIYTDAQGDKLLKLTAQMNKLKSEAYKRGYNVTFDIKNSSMIPTSKESVVVGTDSEGNDKYKNYEVAFDGYTSIPYKVWSKLAKVWFIADYYYELQKSGQANDSGSWETIRNVDTSNYTFSRGIITEEKTIYDGSTPIADYSGNIVISNDYVRSSSNWSNGMVESNDYSYYRPETPGERGILSLAVNEQIRYDNMFRNAYIINPRITSTEAVPGWSVTENTGLRYYKISSIDWVDFRKLINSTIPTTPTTVVLYTESNGYNFDQSFGNYFPFTLPQSYNVSNYAVDNESQTPFSQTGLKNYSFVLVAPWNYKAYKTVDGNSSWSNPSAIMAMNMDQLGTAMKSYNWYADLGDATLNSLLATMPPKSTAETGSLTVTMDESITVAMDYLDRENDPKLKESWSYQYTPMFETSKDSSLFKGQSFNEFRYDWDTTGKYVITGKVTDNPSVDPNFASYQRQSADSLTREVIVHEKPIAWAKLVLDASKNASLYLVDPANGNFYSHDPDRKTWGFSGLQAVEFRGSDFWNNPKTIDFMPRTPGSYVSYYSAYNGGNPSLSLGGYTNVELRVQDLEGAWSDWTPVNSDYFTFDAKFRSQFNTLPTVKYNEILEFHEIKVQVGTPKVHELKWYITDKNGNLKTTVSSRSTDAGQYSYNATLGTYTHNNISMTATLPDGDYKAVIECHASGKLMGKKVFGFSVRNKLIFDAQLKSSGGTLPTIKKGETITFNNIKSTVDFEPYPHDLYFSIKKSDWSANVTPVYTVPFTSGKNWFSSAVSAYRWWDISMNVDLPDGNYIAVIEAWANGIQKGVKWWPLVVKNNTAPTLTIQRAYPSGNPVGKNFIYEGDNVSVDFTPNDNDNDTLTTTYTFKNLTTGADITLSSNTYTAPHAMRTKAILTNATPGNYKLDILAKDPSGASATDSITFTVNALSITGAVNHTTQWEKNRVEFNQAKTGTNNSPHDALTFFSGEKLILEGTTTPINSGSLITASTVTAQLISESMSDTLSKNGSVPNRYDGELWNEEMINWTTRTRTVRFTVTYSNGTMKTDDVVVKFDGDNKYWLFHRKF